jgi:hypothetical protein
MTGRNLTPAVAGFNSQQSANSAIGGNSIRYLMSGSKRGADAWTAPDNCCYNAAKFKETS